MGSYNKFHFKRWRTTTCLLITKVGPDYVMIMTMVTMAWSCYFPWRPCHDHAICLDDHDKILPSSCHGEYESPWSYHVIAWSSGLTMAVNSGQNQPRIPYRVDFFSVFAVIFLISPVFPLITPHFAKNHRYAVIVELRWRNTLLAGFFSKKRRYYCQHLGKKSTNKIWLTWSEGFMKTFEKIH